MNKLKGELCAFCMIFSAIITYSDASYKEDLLKQAGHIAEDLRKEAEGIVHGVHPFLDEKDAGETEKNINNYLKNLKYSDEKIKQLKIEAYGSEEKKDIQEKLEKEKDNVPIIESILDASLRGDIEIPYWYTKDDPAKPFDASDVKELSSDNIALSKLVEFAHDLRTVGYTPTQFLKLYAEPCDSSKDLSSGRCDSCKVHQTVEKVIQNKLSPYKDIFYKFVNVMRSIGNNVTYTLMRKALLYGDAKEKTPGITDTSSADAADLFNFLHIVLQGAYNKGDGGEPGKETSIQGVAYNWLKNPIDLTVCYPKVVNTLVDMMYIAHVGKAATSPDKNIGQKKRHILSQEALKRLNVALEEIEVGGTKYRLVGINDLRIEDASKAVLGLDNSIAGTDTSFLLPVAVLQNKSSTSFGTYDGAPLLIASDIVYICSQHQLPTVSMFFEGGKLISTYRTGYNLMKQSILITDVTHDGSYNNTVPTSHVYGKVTNNKYAQKDWNLENETTIDITSTNTASLIVAELFSWYTKQLDVNEINDLDDRSKYEAEFKKVTAKTQAAHAFIVHNSNTVTNILDKDTLAYTPDTVYKENSEYTNKHYISKEVGGTNLKSGEQKITGEHLIASLLNSSWGETMLRAEDKELVKFKNIDKSKSIIPVTLTASEFNTKGGSRGNNKSSTVHVVTEFENALQKISNYTFPGFQPRESAYGQPLATLGEKAKETTPDFITENADGSKTTNIILEDSKALETALGAMGAKK